LSYFLETNFFFPKLQNIQKALTTDPFDVFTLPTEDVPLPPQPMDQSEDHGVEGGGFVVPMFSPSFPIQTSERPLLPTIYLIWLRGKVFVFKASPSS